MIRIKYLFMAVLLCGVLSACDKKEDSLILEKSNIEIKAKPKTLKSSVNEKSVTSSELETVFTIDDIVSYNGTTGEIIFKNVQENEEIPVFNEFGGNLEFYKDGELLFNLKSRIVQDHESSMYNTPVLYYSRYSDDFKVMGKWKFYIVDGYPWGLPISKYEQSRFKERIENVEKILQGWNIFIECLKKEGKYIE